MSSNSLVYAYSTLALALGLSTAACGTDEQIPRPDDVPGQASQKLKNRAYVVSLHSDELTVIDLDKLEIVGQVRTGGVSNHMAELNRDFTKIYIDSSESDQTIVVDATRLEVTNRIQVGKHPTHLTLAPDGRFFAVMNEGENAVSFIDVAQEAEFKRLRGFQTPHFMRFAPDGRHAFVANIAGDHLSRVDLNTFEIDKDIDLAASSPRLPGLAEGGFADAQIDAQGMLYAAHAASGRVLVYDTIQDRKISELAVGQRPWIVFAEHPFTNVVARHLVPNFGDETVSLIDGPSKSVLAALPGDSEAYGVNYTSQAPDRAFVMNRVRSDVAVVDLNSRQILQRIPVGGNTETASTTPDGRLIVAAVSSANRVVVIDVKTQSIIKTFENVGVYPWSVTIPSGQNYCH